MGVPPSPSVATSANAKPTVQKSAEILPSTASESTEEKTTIATTIELQKIPFVDSENKENLNFDPTEAPRLTTEAQDEEGMEDMQLTLEEIQTIGAITSGITPGETPVTPAPASTTQPIHLFESRSSPSIFFESATAEDDDYEAQTQLWEASKRVKDAFWVEKEIGTFCIFLLHSFVCFSFNLSVFR